jgi:hypothetical protein
MNNKPLVRVSYVDPSTGNQRDGSTANVESRIDQEQYLLPLEQLTGALHDWGIGVGLTVLATIGKAGVKIMPGVGLDSNGHHISLANKGQVEVNPNAAAAGTSTLVAVPVNDGVTFDTTTPPPVVGPGNVVADQYLTIEWKEIFDVKTFSTQGIFQTLQTPWLRLMPVTPTAPYEDGSRLILARVGMDSGGLITSLTQEGRQQTGLTVGGLGFRRGQAVSTVAQQFTVDTGLRVADVGPRASGGLTISADAVAFQTRAGAENFVLDVAGGHWGRSNGPTTFHLSGSQVADTGAGLTLTSANQVTLSTAHLGVGVSAIGTGAAGGDVQFDVAGRARFRKLPADGSAGAWYYQNGADRGFVGLFSDTSIGLYGPVVGWGMTMDTNTGATTIARDLTVNGSSKVGGDFTVNGHLIAGSASIPNLTFANVQLSGSLTAGSIVTTKLGSPNANTNTLVLYSKTVNILGNLTKSSGAFRIDHPLDPANKYLSHSFVESPDMLNIYNGTVTTNADGEAVVRLPDFFETLNRDFRYQLTVIGRFAQAIVSREVADNCFAIRTDKPRVKVSWQVTGVRRDAYAVANPVIVEEDKPEHERGFYLHPELFGEPDSRSVVHADALIVGKEDRHGS